jgi:hypothetical protein
MLRLLARMRRGSFERSGAVDSVRAEIASRIRRVCTNFNEGEFQTLVDRMAEIEMRYRLRDEGLMFHNPTARSAMN